MENRKIQQQSSDSGTAIAPDFVNKRAAIQERVIKMAF
jgi:hypothetical protein